jgi:hypothetical protein
MRFTVEPSRNNIYYVRIQSIGGHLLNGRGMGKTSLVEFHGRLSKISENQCRLVGEIRWFTPASIMTFSYLFALFSCAFIAGIILHSITMLCFILPITLISFAICWVVMNNDYQEFRSTVINLKRMK